MIRRIVSIVLSIAAVAFAAPASSQLAPGYSGWSSAPVEASEAEYWRMMRRLGACLADSKREQAMVFLGSEVDSAEEGEAFDALFHRSRNRCMGNFVNAGMLRAHVRGVVAEGLFQQLPSDLRRSALASPLSEPDVVASIHEFADCYVARHPAEASGLIDETRLGTEGELEYIREIAADFGPCLPEGVEVSLRPINVRMAFAEALYRAATRMPAEFTQGSE